MWSYSILRASTRHIPTDLQGTHSAQVVMHLTSLSSAQISTWGIANKLRLTSDCCMTMLMWDSYVCGACNNYRCSIETHFRVVAAPGRRLDRQWWKIMLLHDYNRRESNVGQNL